MNRLEYRRLYQDSEEDVKDLQKILMAAPGYYLVVEGKPPGETASMEVLQELPPAKSPDDKYVYAIQHLGRLIGCIDVVRGYPHADIAFIGLLLFIETEQGRSHGVKALQYVERLACQWGCTRLRIAVIETNERALAFWKREGFVELYRKPSEQYTGDAMVMERVVTDGRKNLES